MKIFDNMRKCKKDWKFFLNVVVIYFIMIPVYVLIGIGNLSGILMDKVMSYLPKCNFKGEDYE